MIHGLPFQQSIGFGDGLADTVAMAVTGITTSDNLLAVLSWPDAGTSVKGEDVTDFTVGAGTITAGTIDLTGRKFVAIWSSAPDGS